MQSVYILLQGFNNYTFPDIAATVHSGRDDKFFSAVELK